MTTYSGKSVEKVLGSNRNIDIWLGGAEEIALEEIVLTGSQEDVVENKKITAYGDRNADAVGYAVQTITEDDIAAEISTTTNNAIQGKFSGVRLGQNDDLSQAILRPSNSILSTNYGLIVLDGVPLRRSDSSTGAIEDTSFIDPQNIANITVLKGLAATNRFGSLGVNGVILITTKTASFQKPGKKKDLALVTDNLYDGKIKVSSKVLITPYLKALKDARNLKEAYNRYLELRTQYAKEALFYIDIYDYFKSASPAIASRVLTNILEDDQVAYTTLRAMLLKCREDGLHILELDTAQKILERFPNKIQSYLDHALALKANGEYQQCYDQLVKMANGSLNQELDFSKLKKSIEAELKNLVYREGKELKMSSANQKFSQNLRYDVRIIFEWSFPPAEFELQFVNPQKRFFTWEHTSWANDQRLKEEVEDGFAREEFEIVGDGIEGEWLVNVKYLGNANSGDQTPSVLMAKIIYDFGKTTQKEETKLLRLFDKENESQFLKLKI